MINRMEIIDKIADDLRKDKAIKEKYDRCGVYCIYIDDILVYIGKSENMIDRLASHIFYVGHLAYTKSNKYFVLNSAKALQHNVRFDVMLYSTSSSLGWDEGKLIRKYLPPLNYQIPREDDYRKFTVNKIAKTITLTEILGESK